MMPAGFISFDVENSRYAGPEYQKLYATCWDNFLSLLKDAREADACLQEMLRHFSYHLKNHPFESDAKLLNVCLPRIAGAVGSRRFAAKRLRRENRLFNRVRREMVRTFKGDVDVWELALRLVAGFRLPRLKHLPAASQ